MKKLIKQLILGWKYRNIKFQSEGKNCNYRSWKSKFLGYQQIKLGNNTWLGPGTELHGEGGITIGNGVIFGPDVIVYTRTHRFDHPELNALPYDDHVLLKSVTIRDYVWIGRRAIILPGVTIGMGAVIGAGAVVSKSIPDYAVAVGNPAKVIRYRDKKRFEELLDEDPVFVYEKLGHSKKFIRPGKKTTN